MLAVGAVPASCVRARLLAGGGSAEAAPPLGLLESPAAALLGSSRGTLGQQGAEDEAGFVFASACGQGLVVPCTQPVDDDDAPSWADTVCWDGWMGVAGGRTESECALTDINCLALSSTHSS